MAREQAQIKKQMIEEKNNQSSLSSLSSTSNTAKWNLYIFLVSAAIAVFEQIMDSFKSSIEQIAFLAHPGSPQWIKDKVLLFQYDLDTPQVAQLNVGDYTVTYPEVLTNLQIITRCSVTTTIKRKYLVKVAKNEPPEPIDGSEKTALNEYISLLNGAGLDFAILSANSDKIEVVGTVFYDGQYNAVIAVRVKKAIDNYLANIDFDGKISIQILTDNIQAVTGVLDFKLDSIRVRQNTTPYINGSEIYSLVNGINTVTYDTYAGYIEEETESGHTFSDTLTFVAQ